VEHILSSCAFGLIQKHQKIKHGEKQRVTTPALTERAQKTPLLRRNPLRRFDCGGSAKSASGLCVRLLNVVLHTHSWRSPVAVTSSATFSQCDPAGRRPVKTGDQQIIIVARSAPQIPHCTGGGIRSDGGSSARSGRAKQRSLLCPLSENRRPIPTEVPCGHFWRHLSVTKGGKSAPRRKRRIEGAGCFPK